MRLQVLRIPMGHTIQGVVDIIRKYYSYARGANRNSLEDPFNSHPVNRYCIGALASGERSLFRKVLGFRKVLLRSRWHSAPGVEIRRDTSLGRHKLGTALSSFIGGNTERCPNIRIPIVLHDEAIIQVLTVIALLKALPKHPKFVTMTELAETIG